SGAATASRCLSFSSSSSRDTSIVWYLLVDSVIHSAARYYATCLLIYTVQFFPVKINFNGIIRSCAIMIFSII
ncbi:MAG: hypothetical protein VXZ13_04150, partial [Pseudomonadota bacterium]|nr:hypothetical protein [Pseudomonadota bacterium]